MMRAIKMAIAAVGLAGATAVTVPSPACAQVFWPAFGIVPYYNYYYYYPPYQPAFWGAYGYSGYRPLWRHHPDRYRSSSWGWGRRHVYSSYGRAYGFHHYPRLGVARFGGDRHRGSRGHRWYGRAGFGRRAGGHAVGGHGIGGHGIGGHGVGGDRR